MRETVPNWATDPIKRFLDYSDDSHRLLHLSMRGLSMIGGLPRAVEVLADLKQEDEETKRASLDRACADASFAEAEKVKGFPLLHAHTLVGTWAAIEATIEDFLVAFLLNEPELLRNEAFAKIRIPLSGFLILEPDERVRFLFAEFERNQGAGRKYGIDRFEVLFEPFGLTGAVDPEIKRDVREMHHVRNVLVHRAGLADRRLVEGCPWLKLGIGQPVMVTHDAMMRYDDSLSRYVTEIIYRLGARYGRDIKKSLEGERNLEDRAEPSN